MSARARLIRARRRRERAEKDHRDFNLAVVSAAAEGMSKSEIAELTGISRQSVYNILNAERKP